MTGDRCRRAKRNGCYGQAVRSSPIPFPTQTGKVISREVIEAIARGKGTSAREGDFFVHMSRCSPCFNDFARLRRAAQRERRLKAVRIAAIIVIICVAAWFVVKSRRHTGGTYAAVVLDLRNRLVLRGAPETGERTEGPLVLLRGTDNVSIDLPLGSRTGAYDVGIFEKPEKPLVSAIGRAGVESDLTVVKARLDLSELNSGRYLLGIRPPGVDRGYYPLVVQWLG
jgi:hypothetical protein